LEKINGVPEPWLPFISFPYKVGQLGQIEITCKLITVFESIEERREPTNRDIIVKSVFSVVNRLWKNSINS
jgi:hypothetical protein